MLYLKHRVGSVNRPRPSPIEGSPFGQRSNDCRNPLPTYSTLTLIELVGVPGSPNSLELETGNPLARHAMTSRNQLTRGRPGAIQFPSELPRDRRSGHYGRSTRKIRVELALHPPQVFGVRAPHGRSSGRTKDFPCFGVRL